MDQLATTSDDEFRMRCARRNSALKFAPTFSWFILLIMITLLISPLNCKMKRVDLQEVDQYKQSSGREGQDDKYGDSYLNYNNNDNQLHRYYRMLNSTDEVAFLTTSDSAIQTVNSNGGGGGGGLPGSAYETPLLRLGMSIWEAARLDLYRQSPAGVILLCFAYTLVFVIGIVGNSFVVTIVCRSPKMRTVTNIFIANLALADILVLVICLPATLIGNIFVREYPAN